VDTYYRPLVKYERVGFRRHETMPVVISRSTFVVVLAFGIGPAFYHGTTPHLFCVPPSADNKCRDMRVNLRFPPLSQRRARETIINNWLC